ncbi:MarR family winged helix-turn-helix transcriptional regulator [Rhizobium oryzicola]|uniref:MarR family transcriptional regulator n=1 Tax=Rhizobium oryzicola TaxID=1232668 RepID=A0ABT8SXZ0_9HYPH|nr:MarR family transcriptional regulator [Rhizobium oryzicola]MDO1583216.1 MarR family transcriptional regulator [Rhizobium oryzicola]
MTSKESLILLSEVARLLRKRFEQRAQLLGLTRPQWRTLAHLSKNEGMHQAALAELLEIEPIALVRIVDQLVERGFVERRRHATDRRMWLLHTLEAVRPLLDEIHVLADATKEEALKDIEQDRLDQAFAVLSEIKENLLQACATPFAEKEHKNG